MKFPYAALLLPALALPAAAATHTLEAVVSDGRTSYRQTLRLTEGSQANHVGPLKDRYVVLNALLARGEDGYDLQYQLELSNGRGAQGRSVQLQSEAVLSPGEPLAALEYGPWSVTLTLDPPGKGRNKAARTSAAGRNYRLTADVSASGVREVCRLTARAGAQANAVDAIRQGDRKYGFILNALFAKKEGGAFGVQYQLEHHPPSASAPLQLQNEEELKPGVPARLSGEGYELELLLEGPGGGKRRAR